MNVYSLAKGKGSELAQARLEIRDFLSGEPEVWREPHGALTGHERIERMSFAEKYATPKFRGWLMDRELKLEDFVDSHHDIDRLEFSETLTGDGWTLEEER